MLYSMTGYGDAQYEDDSFSLLVEIRSLNNRFLKVSVKLPDLAVFAEPEITRIIRQELNRGSVNYVLHLKQMSETAAMEVNRPALEAYLSSLEPSFTLRKGSGWIRVDLAGLVQLPGVCQPRQISDQQHAWLLERIEQLTGEALQRLRAMRAEEGESLAEDLFQQCRLIRQHLQALGGLTDRVLAQYHQRLQDRVNLMLSQANLQLDEEMLRKELALFAERSDINEEISRLGSHLDQFERICRSEQEQQVGRRLDFLSQEMLREANTIASKAGDATISQHVVEIKVAIDRLKEQIQNVE
ncbi:MAG: YicC family protein [Sedimentisphaerales bacterium]|nr:YicC family protein [Sedimentisphaerales bacterium]